MLKRTVFVLTVLACVGVVYGAAVRLSEFMFYDEAGTPSVMVVMNYSSGDDKTIIQIIMSGLTPMTSYQLQLRPPGEPCPCGDGCSKFVNVLVTDENGDAMGHFVAPITDLTDHRVELYVDDSPADGCLLYPTELHAESIDPS